LTPPSAKADTAPSRSPSVPMSAGAEDLELAVVPSANGAGDLAGYTRDPFGGWMDGRTVDDLVEPGSLLDVPNVRRWFELFAMGLPESLYTYQLPLSRKAGPETEAL